MSVTKENAQLLLIMVKTGEISAKITKSTVWAYWFGERWIEFGIAIKTIHDHSE